MALKEKNGSPKYTKDTKFHGDPSRGCSKILLKTTNDNTTVALEVKINKVKGIHFLGTLNVCKKQQTSSGGMHPRTDPRTDPGPILVRTHVLYGQCGPGGVAFYLTL